MAPSVKCLLCTPEHLGLAFQDPRKKLSSVISTRNPRAQETEDRRIPRVWGLAGLAESVSSRFSKKHYFKNWSGKQQQKKTYHLPLASSCMCTYLLLYLHLSLSLFLTHDYSFALAEFFVFFIINPSNILLHCWMIPSSVAPSPVGKGSGQETEKHFPVFWLPGWFFYFVADTGVVHFISTMRPPEHNSAPIKREAWAEESSDFSEAPIQGDRGDLAEPMTICLQIDLWSWL